MYAGHVMGTETSCSGKQKELQERMVEVSLSEIQERLSLTEMQISQLRPVYKQYQKRLPV